VALNFSKSRQGRQNISFVPAGTWAGCWTFYPALKRWAIIKNPIGFGEIPPQPRRGGIFVAGQSKQIQSSIGAASSGNMPLLRSWRFLRGRFYKYAAPTALKNPEGILSFSPALTRSPTTSQTRMLQLMKGSLVYP